METIGFIGLGTIGGAIALNLQKAGYPMVVHDISPEAMQPLVDGGAKAAGSAAEVARDSQFVLTSLPSHREVEEVALGPNGLLHGIHSGTIYVDLSSSHPDLIRRIEGEFRLRDAQVLDAPIIVGTEGVSNNNLQLMPSGDPETFESAKPLLDAFADRVVFCGPLGSGTVIKLAHNMVRRGFGLAIGEGMVLGTKAGADPELLWECMRYGLDVMLHQLQRTFDKVIFPGDFAAPSGFDINLSRKDVGLATEVARQYNVPMPIHALVEQAMIHAINRGWGKESTASLFKLQEEAAGIEVRARGEG